MDTIKMVRSSNASQRKTTSPTVWHKVHAHMTTASQNTKVSAFEIRRFARDTVLVVCSWSLHC